MKNLITGVLIAIGIFVFEGKLSAQEMKWGDWVKAECFGGVDFRLGRNTEREQQGYKLFVQFRSNYHGKIAFDWVMAGGPNQMFDKLRSGNSKGRIVLEGGKMDDGSSYDYASERNAFIAIGHFRVLNNGGSEDLTRPYEICEYMRKDTVCLMCEYKEVPGCQNDKVMEKNARIISVMNRMGAQGIAPLYLEPNVEDLRRKIIENLKAHVRPFSENVGGGDMTHSTANIIIAAAGDRLKVTYTYERKDRTGIIGTDIYDFSLLFTELTNAVPSKYGEIPTLRVNKNVEQKVSSTVIRDGKRTTQNFTFTDLDVMYYGGENGIKELVDLATKLKGKND